MSSYQTVPEGKDSELWELAHKRAGFKRHLVTYIIINAFFWALWFFSGEGLEEGEFFPWPVWPMLGWGIGIAFHFMGAYVMPQTYSVENEYKKLKEKQ